MKLSAKKTFLILTIVLIAFGVWYRLLLTRNGGFLFNIDNARDMIDVREMVELHKWRLIGPTSGIEGVFDGPGWYYLLAVPYVLTGGNPYGSIVMEIILWAIGAFFLIQLTKKWGVLAILLVMSLWISSNYIVLTNLYAFNPNPVLLLMPLFIFLGAQFLQTGRLKFSIGTFLLGGFLFNCEMAYGFFIPFVLVVSTLLSGKKQLFKQRAFWLGGLAFLLTMLPQAVFEMKHGFFMTHSLLNYLHESSQASYLSGLVIRFHRVIENYKGVLSGTLMNLGDIVNLFIFIVVVTVIWGIKSQKSGTDFAVMLGGVLCLIPLLGHIFIPMNVMPWHLGGTMATLIFLTGFAFYQLTKWGRVIRIFAIVAAVSLIVYAGFNLHLAENLANKTSNDPAQFANEVKAVEYVYNQAQGQGFKLYTYLPSVIDYPYQYITWWLSKTKYHYLPQDYAYLPNKPLYIPGKEALDARQPKRPFGGKVFLLEEPDRNGLKHLWKNSFNANSLVSVQKVGPYEVELRNE